MGLRKITYADVLECIREHLRVKGMWDACSGDAWGEEDYTAAVESRHRVGPVSDNPADTHDFQRVEQFYSELQRFKRLSFNH